MAKNCILRQNHGALNDVRLRVGAFLTILVITVLPLMADTKIVHRWVLTGVPMPRFQKMLIASIMENYLIRQEFEDEMNKLLEKYSVEGIRGVAILYLGPERFQDRPVKVLLKGG